MSLIYQKHGYSEDISVITYTWTHRDTCARARTHTHTERERERERTFTSNKVLSKLKYMYIETIQVKFSD